MNAASSQVLFPERDASEPPPITIGEIIGLLWRDVWLIALCTVIVTALALTLYLVQTPAYTSVARVLVQTEQLGTPSFLSGIAAYRESQVAEPVSRKIETEMALFLNRSNAEQVVSDLGIQPRQVPSTPLALASRFMGDVISRIKGPSAAEARPSSQRTQLAEQFLANVSIEAVRSKTAETTSNVLEVQLDSTDPQLAPTALRAMLDAYLRVGTQQNQKLGLSTAQLLKSQIEESRSELAKIENAIVALAVRESQRGEITAAATAQRPNNSNAGTGDAASQLVRQLLDLQAQLEEARQTFTDETESVRKLKQRVAEARTRLASQLRVSASNNAEFSRLERQRLLAQDHYVELRRKLDQIDLYMQLTPAALDGRVVVDAPTQPERSEAHRNRLVLAAGPLAGLMLGVLLAALREFARQRVRTRREVERLIGAPMLGALPSYKRADSGTAPPSEISELPSK